MRKISFAALTAIIVLTLSTISFGQTSFGSYVTEAISQNFYQLLTPTTAPTGEQITADNRIAVDTDNKTPDENITAAAFTPGNIVVCRVGTGAAALTNAATAAFLDEYSTTGTLVQSIALPTTAATTGNRALTVSGTATSECQVSLSPDGQFVTLGGYNAAPGTAAIAATTNNGSAGDVNRVLARVGTSGTVDTTTALIGTTANPIYTGNNIRNGVISGTNFYSAGSGAPIVGYTAFGTNTATAVGATGSTRVVNIYGGNLYYDTASVISRFTGLPTTASTPTVLTLSGTAPTNLGGYVFLDVGNTGTINTAYLIDGANLRKYSVSASGTTLTAIGTATFTGASNAGLAARVNGTSVTLFSNAPANIQTLTDNSGAGGTLTGTATSIATATTNTAFRSVALVPVAVGNTAPAFTSNASATFTQNVAGSFQVMASGNPAPTFSTNGTLPNGVTLSSAGLLSGTPTQSGTFTFTITATNGIAPDATQSFTLTVNAAANPTVNLSISPTTGSEAAQTLFTATATASSAQTTDQTVNFALTGGTATAADFTTIAGTITIPANSTTGTTTFSVVDDTLVEGTENATFTISNPSAGISLGTTTTASVSITDNDVAATADLTITQSAPATVASGGTLVYTVTFSNTPAAAVTTPFAVSFVLPTSGFSNPTVTSTGGCSASGTISGGTVTFTGCTLPASGTQTVTISGTATATGGTITSGTATVDTGNAVTETDETNNTAAGVTTPVNAAPTSVVVNEIYGGGGNTGASYNSDYIELYNNGTTTVGIGGYSLQYASATGTFNAVIVLPGDTIPAGGFYLVQTRPAQAIGAALTPNFTSPNNVDLSATNGNVLLATGTTTVGACPAAGAANVIDRVGYGTGNCFESATAIVAAAAPAGSNTTSVQRVPNGADTNDNSVDLAARGGTPSATNDLGPTAAGAQISGRVTTADGRGIQNATLMISGNGLREPLYVRTGAFGNYRFNNVPSGETYVISVTARRYIFDNAARVVSLNEDLTAADFKANK